MERVQNKIPICFLTLQTFIYWWLITVDTILQSRGVGYDAEYKIHTEIEFPPFEGESCDDIDRFMKKMADA